MANKGVFTVFGGGQDGNASQDGHDGCDHDHGHCCDHDHGHDHGHDHSGVTQPAPGDICEIPATPQAVDRKPKALPPGLNSLDGNLALAGLPAPRSQKIEFLQINLGTNANRMTRATADLVIAALAKHPQIKTLEIFGESPELSEQFRHLISEAKKLQCHVILHTNLLAFFTPGFDTVPQFLADHQVEVIVPLPCYKQANVDRMLGAGVYDKTIKALRWLNILGYGWEWRLPLHLLHTPPVPALPQSQEKLELDYRQELENEHGISFNRLYSSVNMPLGAYAENLSCTGGLEPYLNTLEDTFNPAAAALAMCREAISVGSEGTLHDCEYNNALGLPLSGDLARMSLADFDITALLNRQVNTGAHCLGCAAAVGSSCRGELTTRRPPVVREW